MGIVNKIGQVQAEKLSKIISRATVAFKILRVHTFIVEINLFDGSKVIFVGFVGLRHLHFSSISRLVYVSKALSSRAIPGHRGQDEFLCVW